MKGTRTTSKKNSYAQLSISSSSCNQLRIIVEALQKSIHESTTQKNLKRGASIVRINEKRITKVSLKDTNDPPSPKSCAPSIRSEVEEMIRKIQQFQSLAEHKKEQNLEIQMIDKNRIKLVEDKITNFEIILSKQIGRLKNQYEALQQDIGQLIILYKQMIIGG